VALESVSTDRVYVLEPALTVTVPNHEGMKVSTGGVTVALAGSANVLSNEDRHSSAATGQGRTNLT